MTCRGSLPSDCDTYSQAFAYSIAAGEKFGAIFLHMDEATAKGHIVYALFWSITGTLCTWLGLILLLYSEIKAVTVVSTHAPPSAIFPSGSRSPIQQASPAARARVAGNRRPASH